MRCLAGQGRWSDAGAIIDRLCEGIKNEPETLAECADICLQASDRRQALALYQKAAEGDPERTDWQIQIARLAIVQHKQQLAKETAERVLERGEDAEMRVMLASIMHRARNLSAMAEHLDAVPDEGDQMANAANLRGMMLVSQTNINEGLETMARTRFLAPDAFQLQSTRVMYLNYDPDLSRDDLRRQHMDCGERFKTALPLLPQDFTERSHDPQRKLRIGFVSPDFRAHSVAYFARPFFDAFDRERFDVIAYAHVPAEDSVTADLRALTTGWRDIFSWSEQQLAEEVRRDRIDILIDLTGLTRDTRIRAFTARPAPVQMTYIGYPNTTGLAQIDYRITDWITDPEGVEDDYSETLIRMPGCFLCYAIPSHAPALEPGPCEHRGYVTFGSFNNFAKVNPAVLDLWAEVLNAIPHAKLLLKSTSSNDPTAQVIVRDRLTQRGVDPKRVSFADYRTTQASHLAIYHDIDIALDTFPYNGTTTTCEALWMGVPVITLAGDRHAGRVGASLLKTVGFEAGITKTSEEFVTTARLMAENPGILRTIRRTLRDTVYRSSLCDNKTHARTLEDALRATWQIWCEQRCDRSDQGIIP
jgi:predicted O-linked N-acetylglucosamine transferase (SPINDLY family)